MSEKEKMLSGNLYHYNDEQLVKERQKCKKFCFEFNQTHFEDVEKRMELLKENLGKTGERFLIEQPFLCDYASNIKIGENFYANYNLTILDCAPVEFGDNVLIGPNCSFYTPNHPLDVETRITPVEYAKPIKVGNNVWFGGSVVVLGGVTIGDNSVIGAGSVVVKDIPANSLAVGNPCKVIRKI